MQTAVFRFLPLRTIALAICLVPVALPAAERYPSKPVRLLVGFPPGGGADATARVVAEKLTTALGEQVIVDNRAGASGNIAAEMTAHAVPDGHTMLIASMASLVINPILHKKLPFDPNRDFAPVTLAVSQTNVLVVHPSLPVKSVKDLIALANSKPGQLSFSSAGIGTATHLSAALFNSMAKVTMFHVPYKGGGPAMIALLSGEVPLMFAPLAAAASQIKAGRLRAFAVTTAKRSALMPELPTIAETGLPGYEAYTWYGVLAPARTPRPIIERLNKEIVAILKMPEVTAALLQQGLDTSPMTSEEFGAYIKSETAKWAQLLKASQADAK